MKNRSSFKGKPMIKKLLSLVFLLVIACGCTVPPDDAGSLAGATVSEKIPLYQNMDGQTIDLWSEDLSGVTLCYTLGWKLDGKKYVRLQKNFQWGNAVITDVYSAYSIYRSIGHPIETICTASSYTFCCPSVIPGILQVEESSITFFPYQSADIPMFFLHPRTAQVERDHAAQDRVSLQDGTTLKVHPIGIQLIPKDEERTLLLLSSDGDRPLPRWYDAELRFSSVWVSGFCQAETEGVIATRASGELEWEDPVMVKGELLLVEGLW